MDVIIIKTLSVTNRCRYNIPCHVGSQCFLFIGGFRIQWRFQDFHGGGGGKPTPDRGALDYNLVNFLPKSAGK